MVLQSKQIPLRNYLSIQSQHFIRLQMLIWQVHLMQPDFSN